MPEKKRFRYLELPAVPGMLAPGVRGPEAATFGHGAHRQVDVLHNAHQLHHFAEKCKESRYLIRTGIVTKHKRLLS